MIEWLEEIGRRLDLSISPTQQGQYLTYIELLREWNQKINLTTVVDDEGIAIRHLLDSLTLISDVDQYAAAHPDRSLKLIDVGSGAGFPGLPLKIQRPDCQILLLDSLAKRIKFLDTVIESLKLQGITARHGRAEEAARAVDLREKFDIATARAVAALPVLCEYCMPFVKVGGIFLAMKGQAAENWSDAKPAIKKLGGKLREIREFELPGTDMKRTILVIQKIAKTPVAYPRKAGKVESSPL